MFCGCELGFGEEPNTRTCPVCLGLPGALPVVNARAIDFGLLMGMALGCEIAPRRSSTARTTSIPTRPRTTRSPSTTSRCAPAGGWATCGCTGSTSRRTRRKLVHWGSRAVHGSDASIVDYNRAGTPLIEIVTEPDLHSAEQAREWLTLLRETLRQLGVSDVNMEEGSLRCDANVSIRPVGSRSSGPRPSSRT